jgi:peptidoglycan/xylan/chitin deacetylase (PgdA/CDA1 family)
MKMAITAFAKKSLHMLGHYSRRLSKSKFGGVAVLCYHGVVSSRISDSQVPFRVLHVTDEELESHCRFLREECNPISLHSWKASLSGGPPLPPRPVLVTFDDGYRSVFTLARPILQKYSIPTVIFVCSDPVEKRQLLWYDAAARSIGESRVDAVGRLPYAKWQEACGKFDMWVSEDDPTSLLSVDEIKTLAAIAGIEIGGHTTTHVRLTTASREEQHRQVIRNKQRLEEWTGTTIRAFAYPNGLPVADYDSDSIAAVKAAGYEFAFTTVQKFAGGNQRFFEVPRFLMLAGISVPELAHRLCYSWPRVHVPAVS